mgnify:CR=1 FL=1
MNDVPTQVVATTANPSAPNRNRGTAAGRSDARQLSHQRVASDHALQTERQRDRHDRRQSLRHRRHRQKATTHPPRKMRIHARGLNAPHSHGASPHPPRNRRSGGGCETDFLRGVDSLGFLAEQFLAAWPVPNAPVPSPREHDRGDNSPKLNFALCPHKPDHPTFVAYATKVCRRTRDGSWGVSTSNNGRASGP